MKFLTLGLVNDADPCGEPGHLNLFTNNSKGYMTRKGTCI
jgi:hypothetical protein